MLSDLETDGYAASLYTIEIGTLSHWLNSSLPSLTKQQATKLLDTAAAKVVSASQIIFRERTDLSWTPSCVLL